MKSYSMFLLVLCCSVLSAQGQESFTIKPGENILNVVQLKNIFKYPAFTNGSVIFRDGRKVGSRLNYNCLIGEMQFIDGKGDTLSLGEENTVKYIVITNDSFCYDGGYIELINQGANADLGKRVYYKEFEQKKGTYGLSSGTSSAINASSIIDKTAFNFNTDKELTLVKTTDFVIGNRNQFLIADKKNLLKLFPKHKKTIVEYLDTTPIDFKEEKDLMKLTKFLMAL